MQRSEMREAIFHNRTRPAKIRGVLTEDRVETVIANMPLGEAITFVAEGAAGHLTTGATVSFGDDGSLDHAQCRDLFRHFGSKLISIDE